MVKAKEFWEVVCDKLGYRFFCGVACKGFDPLYKSMDPGKMHYVPAVNERTAFGLATGVSFGGIKSAVFIHNQGLAELAVVESYIKEMTTHLMIFVSGIPKDKKILTQLTSPQLLIKNKSNTITRVVKFSNDLYENNDVGIVLFGEGIIV